MSKFVRKEVRYRHGVETPPMTSTAHIHNDTVTVGNTYHLESDAQFKRDLEQSLADIVTRRLQEAEDEAIALVKIAEATAETNAKQIADDILTKANAQAREMVETAQSQVDGIKEEAREEGFKSGFQEGYADATTQVEQDTVALLQGVQSLTEKAYQAEKLVLKNFEKNAIELITYITKKALHRELQDSPETILNLVQQAVESLYLSGKVKVVVNPQILQDIRAFSTVTEGALEQMKRFEFIVDPALELTQLFIIAEEGCFDLSPDTQVAQLITPLGASLTLPRPAADLETSELAFSPPEAQTPDSPVIENNMAETATIDTSAEQASNNASVEPVETAANPEQAEIEFPVNDPAISITELDIPADETPLESKLEQSPAPIDSDESESSVTELNLPDVSTTPEVKPYQFESFDQQSDEEAP